jgi:hypothetical protein
MTDDLTSEEPRDRHSGPLQVLVILNWYDGPLEGVLRLGGDTDACWYFKAVAQRPQSVELDDRLFGLWRIRNQDAQVLVDEFGGAESGTRVWPVSGGLGSPAAQRIVEGLLVPRQTMPDVFLRSSDFIEVRDTWVAVWD